MLFGDECSAEKSKDSRTVWVFGSPQGEYYKDAVDGVLKGNGVKLMVWAYIWGLEESANP